MLSKVEFLDTVSGPSLYKKINTLGDEMRRAIELDFESKRHEKKVTLAVVAVPPFPLIPDNTSISLDVARTIVRKLRVLASFDSNLTVVSDESRRLEKFVAEDFEKAVMAREMNARFLLLVRCDRPGRDLQLTSEMFDLQNPNRQGKSYRPQVIRMDSLNYGIDSLLVDVLGNQPFDKGLVDSLDQTKEITFPQRPRTIAVLSLPPIPNTSENRWFSVGIMRTVAAKLRSLEGAQLEVVSAEERLREDYLTQHFDKDSIVALFDPDYLWTIRFDRAGHVRRLFMERSNRRNPYEEVYPADTIIKHLDDLNDIIGGMTTKILKDSGYEVTCKLNEIEFETESGGIRLRGGILGFLHPSEKLFLGNKYRYGIEVAGIYYNLPMQYEITAVYDFGKRGGDQLVYGRYISLLARYNFTSIPGLVNVRLYAGWSVP